MLSLLDLVQHVIDRLYDRTPRSPAAAPYLIGDDGYRRFYGGGPVTRRVVSSGGGDGANVLLRPAGDALRLAIYFPDDLITLLERHNPMAALDDANICGFLTFVEELDHFGLLVQKWQHGEDATLLELELHANVTKHFVARHFVRRREGSLSAGHALWLDYHLFHAAEFAEPDEAIRSRYAEARRLAYHYLQGLARLTAADRLRELRHWSALGPQAKLAAIQRL